MGPIAVFVGPYEIKTLLIDFDGLKRLIEPGVNLSL